MSQRVSKGAVSALHGAKISVAGFRGRERIVKVVVTDSEGFYQETEMSTRQAKAIIEHLSAAVAALEG